MGMTVSEVAKEAQEKYAEIVWPTKPTKPTKAAGETHEDFGKRMDGYEGELSEFYKARNECQNKGADIFSWFKAEAIIAAGLAGHPKADKVWQVARDKGDGYHEIASWLEELAELVL